jgi:hypothetical protein
VKGRAEAFRLKSMVDGAFGRVARVPIDEFELRSDYARYLCILVSGYLEKGTQELAMECCRRSSSGPVRNYAISRLDWSRNPAPDSLLELVGSFSLDWRDQLDQFLTTERRAAVGSIVSIRNTVSHGGWVAVTPGRAQDYYQRVQEVVEFLADVFDPVRPATTGT